MASDRVGGSWSRWDVPGGSPVTNAPQPQRLFDNTQQSIQQVINVPFQNGMQLETTRINTIDPAFYDCVYRRLDGSQVIEQCYKDLGCCANGCCGNSDWRNKYNWAVALIVIFCILVVIAFVVSMIVWLINRSKDKRQKRQLIGGISPATSQMSLAQPIQNGWHFGTGPFQQTPPPGNGYRY